MEATEIADLLRGRHWRELELDELVCKYFFHDASGDPILSASLPHCVIAAL